MLVVVVLGEISFDFCVVIYVNVVYGGCVVFVLCFWWLGVLVVFVCLSCVSLGYDGKVLEFSCVCFLYCFNGMVLEIFCSLDFWVFIFLGVEIWKVWVFLK